MHAGLALADIEAGARRKAAGKVLAPISPLALEITQRMDRLFEIERGINGKSADERRAVRQSLSRPLVDKLEALIRAERAKLSRGNDLAKALSTNINARSQPWRPFAYSLIMRQDG